jgi:septum formation protein
MIREFEVLPSGIDERQLPGEKPKALAVRLATEKARSVALMRPDAVVIGADTVVELDGESLAKPEDAEDARRMLSRLSGKTHEVTTGVCIIQDGGEDAFQVTTEVEFRKLEGLEIEVYVATGEPMDKAGAYAIQGGAKAFVVKVRGSIANVVGFPVEVISGRLGTAEGET